MKRKLHISIALLLFLSLLLGLSACGTTPETTTQPPEDPATQTPADPTTQTPTDVSPPEQPITLTFWNIWGGGDANTEAVNKVVDDWNAANPDIQVVQETYENEAYKTLIKTTVAGDMAPDIFSTWGAGFSVDFVSAGRILQLDSYLNDGTRDRINGGALDYFIYDGGTYGLTFGKTASGFFVNKAVFDDNGIALPKTWDELMTASEALKAAGITPIITSSKERWVLGMLFEGLCTKAVGAGKVNKTINKEAGGSYSDPNFLDALNRLGELKTKGYINSDAAAITRDEALAAFKDGKAGLYYMGAWECASLEDNDSSIKGKVDWIPFPAIAGGGGAATEFNGGSIDGLMVSANTAYPDQAAAFVKYFCENMSRESYQAGNYMPVWTISQVDESKLLPVFTKIAEATKSATGFVIWWDTFLAGDDVTIYQDELENYFNGVMTAEQAQAEFARIAP